MAYVPYTYEELAPNAADILKRQRRAEALRNAQGEFKAVRSPPRQQLERSVKGGLYETVPMYAPKSTLGSIAEIGGGLLGEYLTGKKAKTAEDELEAARAEGILKASQQRGADGLPVAPAAAPQQAGQATLGSGRMGAGLAAAGFPAPGAAPVAPVAPVAPGMTPPPVTGGPEAATAPAPFPTQQSPLAQELAGADVGQEALDQIALLENDRGRALDDNQLREFLQTQKVQTPDSPEAPPAPPRSQDEIAAYLGIGSTSAPVEVPLPNKAKVNIAELSPEANARLSQAMTEIEAQGLPEEEVAAKFQELMAAEMMQGATPEQTAQAQAAGLTSLPPAQAAPPAAPAEPAPPAASMGPAANDINAMLGMAPAGGPPPGPEGTTPTDQALRAYLGMIGGPDMKDILGGGRRVVKTQNLEGGKILKIFNDGTEEISDNIAESRSKERYDEATGYVYRSFSTGPNAGTVQLVTNEDGTPLKLTPSEANARGIARGKAVGQVEGETSTIDAAAENARKLAAGGTTGRLTAENKVAAQVALPKARAHAARTARDVNRLLNNKSGLDDLLSGVGGKLSSLPFGEALTDAYFGALKTGSPAANAYAAHQQLTSEAFLESYQEALKGTGPVSNIEGLKGARANLQNALYQSPEEYKIRLEEFRDEALKLEQRIAEAAAEEGGAPASMEGWSVRVK